MISPLMSSIVNANKPNNENIAVANTSMIIADAGLHVASNISINTPKKPIISPIVPNNDVVIGELLLPVRYNSCPPAFSQVNCHA